MKTRETRRAHQYPTLRQYMTPTPCTIGPSSTLARARQEMLDHGVRHLPVLDGRKIVGLLSERDLFMVEAIPGANPTVVRVEEAMVGDPFVASPDATVAEVVATMIERKMGSAIVADDSGRIVGVFTTIDALRALSDVLAAA